MPVTKPSELPEWATGGGADIADPPTVYKQNGWVGAQHPPAQVFNWVLNLLYLWMAYLNDLSNQVWIWTNTHLFEKAVTTKENAEKTPQLQTINGDDLLMGGFDRLGFPSARPSLNWIENWLDQFQATADGLVFANSKWCFSALSGTSQGTSSQVVAKADIAVAPYFPTAYVFPGNAINNAAFISTGNNNIGNVGGLLRLDNDPDVQLVAEWTAALEAHANSTDYYMGFTLMGGLDFDATHPHMIAFKRPSSGGGGQFQACVGDGTNLPLVQGSGIAPSTNIEFHRFRIEIHGANSRYGQNTVLFFVDDTLVGAEVQTNLPTGPLVLAFGGKRNANSETNGLFVGPVHVRRSTLA